MPDDSPAHAFIDALFEWASAWRPATHSVETHRGPTNVDKASGWVQAFGARSAGQVTVWETGESEMEVYYVSTLRPPWLRHFDFATRDELAEALGRFASALGDPKPR
jgi:hypothetical protein